MKVNKKATWGKKALVLNETTCALTFARLFEYSITLLPWKPSRSCSARVGDVVTKLI